MSLEEMRYREELAEKVGLPSPYGTKLILEFCQELVNSGLVPDCFKKNPSAVYMAVMRGREMGLQPAESVMEVFYAAPSGRLGMYATKMLDMLHRGGVISKFIHEGADYCEVLFTPPAPFEPYTSRFDIEEAQRAGLVKADSNWFKWPKAMNRSRATSYAWRALIGTFKGSCNIYSEHELQEMEIPSEAAPQEPAPRLEVAVGTRPKPGRESEVIISESENGNPVITMPLPGVTEKDPPAVTKTGEEWLIKIGTGAGLKTEKVIDFGYGSSRLIVLARENPGVECVLDQTQFYSNGTSVLTTRARQTDTSAESKPGPVAVPPPATQTAPPAESGDDAKAALRARAMGAYASIPVDPASQKTMGDSFLCGFYGVPVPKQWPKNITERTAGVDALEKAIRMYPEKFKVDVATVKGLGFEMSQKTVKDDSAPLYKELGWSEETAAIARRARDSFQHDASDFADWVGFFKLGSLDENDAAAFMSCAAASGRGTNNMKNFRDLAERIHKSYSSIAKAISLEYEKPMIELTEKQIGEGLAFIASLADRDGTVVAAQPATEQQPAAEPIPTAGPGEDWD
jgi:hypothetical protein